MRGLFLPDSRELSDLIPAAAVCSSASSSQMSASDIKYGEPGSNVSGQLAEALLRGNTVTYSVSILSALSSLFFCGYVVWHSQQTIGVKFALAASYVLIAAGCIDISKYVNDNIYSDHLKGKALAPNALLMRIKGTWGTTLKSFVLFFGGVFFLYTVVMNGLDLPLSPPSTSVPSIPSAEQQFILFLLRSSLLGGLMALICSMFWASKVVRNNADAQANLD